MLRQAQARMEGIESWLEGISGYSKVGTPLREVRVGPPALSQGRGKSVLVWVPVSDLGK